MQINVDKYTFSVPGPLMLQIFEVLKKLPYDLTGDLHVAQVDKLMQQQALEQHRKEQEDAANNSTVRDSQD